VLTVGINAINFLREMVKSESGRARLAPLLPQLTPRERQVIELRIGLTEEGYLTHKQIGQKALPAPVGPERIRQNESRALRRLRRWDRTLLESSSSDTLED
jgi:RNA polymerase nonessential primary-like sigma factor